MEGTPEEESLEATLDNGQRV